MCIIAAKPAGVKMPDHETLENMWYGNPDGAGLMYAKDGKVIIRKGFMKYVDLLAALEEIGAQKGKTLDEGVVDACTAVFRDGNFKLDEG